MPQVVGIILRVVRTSVCVLLWLGERVTVKNEADLEPQRPQRAFASSAPGNSEQLSGQLRAAPMGAERANDTAAGAGGGGALGEGGGPARACT